MEREIERKRERDREERWKEGEKDIARKYSCLRCRNQLACVGVCLEQNGCVCLRVMGIIDIPSLKP